RIERFLACGREEQALKECADALRQSAAKLGTLRSKHPDVPRFRRLLEGTLLNCCEATLRTSELELAEKALSDVHVLLDSSSIGDGGTYADFELAGATRVLRARVAVRRGLFSYARAYFAAGINDYQKAIDAAGECVHLRKTLDSLRREQ